MGSCFSRPSFVSSIIISTDALYSRPRDCNVVGSLSNYRNLRLGHSDLRRDGVAHIAEIIVREGVAW